MVGASPLLSAAFHDEPTIEALNLMQLDVTSVGNHEFDEGVTELLRLQNGGCHPTDGCQDGDPFAGADFPYLAANVVDKVTRKPILPPYLDPQGPGRVGGLHRDDPRRHSRHRQPGRHHHVDFLDEADTANHYTHVLESKGVHAIVILLHEGGQQNPPPSTIDPCGCANFSGALPGIVANLDPDIDLVVSGHTHRSYVCHLPNSTGGSVLTTSAATAGVLVTDITATLSKKSDDFTSLSARNVTVSQRHPEPGRHLAEGRERQLREEPCAGRPRHEDAARQVPHRGGAARQPDRRLDHRRHHPDQQRRRRERAR